MTVTLHQALNEHEFHRGECFLTHGPKGGVKEEVTRYRRNGITQLWVTRPEEFRTPVKYGMRDYDQLTHENADEFHVAGDCPLRNTEYREQMPNGWIVQVSKQGGGTLGKRYGNGERWDVQVFKPKPGALVELADDVVTTGTPKSHKEVARLAMEFVQGDHPDTGPMEF